MQSVIADVQATLGPLWPVLVFLLILLTGYVVAKVAEGLVKRGLRRTSFDDHLAAKLRGEPMTVSSESIGGSIAFWLLMLFTLIIAFEAVDLGSVNQSLGTFADRILGYVPNLIGAALLALIAYVLAVILRGITTRALVAAGVDERVRSADEGRSRWTTPSATEPSRTSAGRSNTIATSLGEGVFYLVLLLFLPAILDALELTGILTPVQEMLNEVLAFLPNLILAAVVLIVGLFAAKVVRNVIENLLAAVGTDRLSERVGLARATGDIALSQLLGLVGYILVLIPVIVAALSALDVDAITAPASAMLAEFLEAIPNIFVAALILGIAWVVGRLIASLVSNLLAGIGFNRLIYALGVRRPEGSVAGDDATAEGAAPRTSDLALETRTPAGVAGLLVLVAIMLFAATEAAMALGLEAVAILIGELTVVAGRVLLGVAIFGVGLYLGRLAENAVRDSGGRQASLLATTAKISIVVLAAAMGLKQMGLADSIINLAFGLTLGALAVAAALAYGLGGREVAREHLERVMRRVDAPPTPETPPR